MQTQVSLHDISRVLDGVISNPREVLGRHETMVEGRRAYSVRAFLPNANQVWLLDDRNATKRPMKKIHPAGFFEGLMPMEPDNTNYRLRVSKNDGNTIEMHDPYSIPSLLTDFDRYLFGSGRHWQIYEKMGAHLRDVDGMVGVNFAVWAPNAQSIQVVGDFNHWDGRQHTMQKQIPSGIWELFVPGAHTGQKYKYRVRFADGQVVDKTDPFGFCAELPPRTASIVQPLDGYQWNDQNWLAQRSETNQLNRPISIYEVHLGSWRNVKGASMAG